MISNLTVRFIYFLGYKVITDKGLLHGHLKFFIFMNRETYYFFAVHFFLENHPHENTPTIYINLSTYFLVGAFIY